MTSWDGQDLTVDHKILGDKLAKKGYDSLNSINILKGDDRYTNGIEYLEEAVEHYIRADADQEAAETALKLAEAYETFLYNKKKGNPHDMAKYWELAGDCLDDFNEKKAIECYHKCAYYQKTNNNYQSAAKTYHLIAQLEQKKEHVKEAVEAYDNAADAFITQSSFVHASKILTEKGEYLAKDASYAESAACFATIIQKNLQPFENQALGFKSMLAMLTHSAISQEVSHVVEHDKFLQSIDEKWLKSYERKCVMKMVEAYKKVPLDISAFTRAIKDYDVVSTLSTWEVELLLTIKKVMEGQLTLGGSRDTYEWIQTSKTADVNADDEEDVHRGIYHRTEHITPTHSEKYAELFQ